MFLLGALLCRSLSLGRGSTPGHLTPNQQSTIYFPLLPSVENWITRPLIHGDLQSQSTPKHS
jgi:hypothetical protein